MRNYKTPSPKELKDPILDILSDGKVWKRKEIIDEIAERFNLSEKDIKGDLYPSGYATRLPSYCTKALEQLEDEELVKR